VTSIEDVRNLLVLMDLVWQQNFRAGMREGGVAMGLCLPRWQRVLSYFDLDILPPTDFCDLKDENSEVSDALKIELTIELPTLGALKKTNGDVIRKVWKDGGTYRTALGEWRRSPTKANKHRVGGSWSLDPGDRRCIGDLDGLCRSAYGGSQR
jgi:hypothetical protein